jgi:hypothetical protein
MAGIKRYFERLVAEEKALRPALVKNSRLAITSLYIYKLTLLITLSDSELNELLLHPHLTSSFLVATADDVALANDVFRGSKSTGDRLDIFMSSKKVWSGEDRTSEEVLSVFQLSQCSEHILQSGGDDRLNLDPITLENKYASSTIPRDEVIRRGSCTCTTINTAEFEYAESIRVRMLLAILLNKNSYTNIMEEASQSIRNQIHRIISENSAKLPNHLTSQTSVSASEILGSASGPIVSDDVEEPRSLKRGESFSAQANAMGNKGLSSVMNTPVVNIGVAAVAGVVGSAVSVASRVSTVAFDTSSRVFDVSKCALTDITMLPVGVASDSMSTIVASNRPGNAGSRGSQFRPMIFPSGTDAEYLPVLLALNRSCCQAADLYRNDDSNTEPSRHIRPKVINVVSAAGEVGSGTSPASQGVHFSGQAPVGFPQKNLHPVFNCSTSHISSSTMTSFSSDASITVINHKLRVAAGTPALDEVTFFTNLRLILEKEPVHTVMVIHVVVCSKTGLVFPSVDRINAFRRDYPTRIIVVVDACQFRMKLEMIASYLDLNYIVLITGSKFFCGPPFR